MNLVKLASMVAESTKKYENVKFFTILHRKPVPSSYFCKNVDLNRTMRLLVKFCFSLVPETLNLEVAITTTSCLFIDFNNAKK